MRNKTIIMLLIIFITFLVIGIIYSIFLNGEEKSELVNDINEIDITKLNENKINIFIPKLLKLLFIWITGMTVIGIIAIPLLIVLEAFSTGFSLAFLCYSFFLIENKILFVTSIACKILIELPIFAIMCLSGIRIGKYLITNKKYNDLKLKFTGYLVVTFVAFWCLLIETFVEIWIYKSIF